LLCSGQQQVQGGQDLMVELLERATPWVRDGSLKHKEDIVDGLENPPEAFLGMLDGKNFGKLLVPVS
jgi:NADPH-dependent curcumin reductase CurA